MTFNEGMQIDTSTTSTSGGGGGGGGGHRDRRRARRVADRRRRPVPRRRPRHRAAAGRHEQYDTQGVEAPGFDLSQCKTGKDANNIVQCRVVATGNSVDGVWSQLLKGYTRPTCSCSASR